MVNDPRVQTSHEDLVEQQQLLLAMRDKVSAVHEAIIRARSVREQVEGWKKRLTGAPMRCRPAISCWASWRRSRMHCIFPVTTR